MPGPVRVAGLADGLDQALHAAVVRLLVLAGLHEEQDHLVELEHGPGRALEGAALRPPLPVDAGDAEAELGRLGRERGLEEGVQEGRGLALAPDELDALGRAEEPALLAQEEDPAQGAVLLARAGGHAVFFLLLGMGSCFYPGSFALGASRRPEPRPVHKKRMRKRKYCALQDTPHPAQPLEAEAPMPTVHNIVATAQITSTIPMLDLNKIHEMLPFSFYDQNKFAAITVRLHDPDCTTLLFSSGKLVVTGCRCWPFSPPLVKTKR